MSPQLWVTNVRRMRKTFAKQWFVSQAHTCAADSVSISAGAGAHPALVLTLLGRVAGAILG